MASEAWPSCAAAPLEVNSRSMIVATVLRKAWGVTQSRPASSRMARHWRRTLCAETQVPLRVANTASRPFEGALARRRRRTSTAKPGRNSVRSPAADFVESWRTMPASLTLHQRSRHRECRPRTVQVDVAPSDRQDLVDPQTRPQGDVDDVGQITARPRAERPAAIGAFSRPPGADCHPYRFELGLVERADGPLRRAQAADIADRVDRDRVVANRQPHDLTEHLLGGLCLCRTPSGVGLEEAVSHRHRHLPYTQPVSYTHLRAHETKANLVCRLLLEK